MKFGRRLSLEAIPEWYAKYLNYDSLKRNLKNLAPEDSITTTRRPVSENDTDYDENKTYNENFIMNNPEYIEEEKVFFERLEDEIQKVNEFYRETELNILNTKNILLRQIGHIINTNSKFKHHVKDIEDIISTNNIQLQKEDRKIILETNLFEPGKEGLSQRRSSQTNKQIYHLKKSMLEYYRRLIILQSYQKLNFTGFYKILKKYDKITGRNVKQSYLEYIEGKHVFSSKTLDSLILDVENIYSIIFTMGNRHKAMSRLRLPTANYRETNNDSISFLCGILLAVNVFFMYKILNYITIFNDGLVNIYLGLFLIFFASWLLGINLFVWNVSRINYRFIFELNPRDHLLLPEYFCLVLSFSMIFLALSWASLNGYMDAFIAVHLQPVFAMSVILLVLAFPLKTFYFSSRFWLLNLMLRVFIPTGQVRFKDFFLADIFMSLTYVFRIPLFICMFDSFVERKNEVMVSLVHCVLLTIPADIRIIQCIRRYVDSGHFFPHIANMIKYFMSFFVIVFGACAGCWVSRERFVQISIPFALCQSIYSLYWDLVMDWGFLKNSRKNFLLRDNLAYKWKFVYYMAIFNNTMMRFLWLIPYRFKLNMFHIYFLAVFEVLRRFQWCFFRVEHEHLNNCGEFKAFHDISLPFESDLFFKSQQHTQNGENDNNDAVIFINNVSDNNMSEISVSDTETDQDIWKPDNDTKKKY